MSELPAGWERARVGDLIEIAPRTDCPDDTLVGFVPLQRLGTAFRSRHTFEPRRWSEVRKGYTHFENGDVLLARITPSFENGKAGIARDLPNGLGAGSTEYFVCRSRDQALVPEYLLAHFKTRAFLRDGEQVMSGAVGQQRVPKQYVLDSEIPLAPLPEQKRIADKLDALLARVDACRQRLDRVPNILKRFRQSVLAAATSGELTREWREERGGAQQWAATRVEEIAFVGTGSTPLRSNSAFYAETGTPWITSSMTGLPFVTQADEFVTDVAIVAHRLKKYPAGTLLVAMYGEGKTRGQVTELRIEATINQACAAICVNEHKALRAFVRLALEANYLEMRELAEGGNQPNLNLSKIKEFPLSLPSLDEQRAITARVEAIYEWLGKTETRLSAARQHVDSSTEAFLAKAFRGELVPQDPHDEPASKLLARLRTGSGSAGNSSKPKRGAKRGSRTNAKADTNMLTRKDVPPAHLTTILKERGALTAEALWTASQLEIDDFYDQLKDEEDRGLLRENRGDGPNAPRLLEPAA